MRVGYMVHQTFKCFLQPKPALKEISLKIFTVSKGLASPLWLGCSIRWSWCGSDPLEHWFYLVWSPKSDFSEQRWCRSYNRCWYFKFFVVLTLVGWGCKSKAGPRGCISNRGEILKLPEKPSRAPEIVLVCKPRVSRLVLLHAESYQGYCVKLFW